MKHEFLKLLLNHASVTKNNEKFSLILALYAEYKLLFLVLFFSSYWPLLSNILAVSQVSEDR